MMGSNPMTFSTLSLEIASLHLPTAGRLLDSARVSRVLYYFRNARHARNSSGSSNQRNVKKALAETQRRKI